MADNKKGKGKDQKVTTPHDDDFKHLVRISNTDLDGNKKAIVALTGVKGIGIRLAPIVADKAGVDRQMLIGNITDEQVIKIQEVVDSMADVAPEWMRNRRKDYVTGEDAHFIGQELTLTHTDDLNRLKKIRSYRGVRHENNLPARGQRTRSNGRSGLTVGVQRKK